MAKLDEQKKVLVEYFQQGCKPEGKLTLGLEVEHFVTHPGGEPVTFDEIQSVMRQMQQPYDTSIVIDGEYMGYTTETYGVSLEPACQVEISIIPQGNVLKIMDIYNQFYLQLSMTLAARGLRAWTVSYHPTRRAEELPLIQIGRASCRERV